ncbi:MAG: hypothetical protein DME97_09230 [Verrucomicrobia bacterium]|nr:MAG: hypothetical protein DME97_09230 [Verrucomicrobiota bacterium]
MHRFYLAPEHWQSHALQLTGAEAHHCRNVLRLESGDKVVLFDGRGHELTAEIASADSSEISLRKLHEAQTPPLRCQMARPRSRRFCPIARSCASMKKAPPRNRRSGKR